MLEKHIGMHSCKANMEYLSISVDVSYYLSLV